MGIIWIIWYTKQFCILWKNASAGRNIRQHISYLSQQHRSPAKISGADEMQENKHRLNCNPIPYLKASFAESNGTYFWILKKSWVTWFIKQQAFKSLWDTTPSMILYTFSSAFTFHHHHHHHLQKNNPLQPFYLWKENKKQAGICPYTKVRLAFGPIGRKTIRVFNERKGPSIQNPSFLPAAIQKPVGKTCPREDEGDEHTPPGLLQRLEAASFEFGVRLGATHSLFLSF